MTFSVILLHSLGLAPVEFGTDGIENTGTRNKIQKSLKINPFNINELT